MIVFLRYNKKMTVFSDKKTIFAVLVLILVIVAVGAWFSWGRGTEPEKENVSTPTGGFIVSVPDKPFFGKTVTSLPAFITEESEKTPQKDDFSAFFEETTKQVFVSIEELKKQLGFLAGSQKIESPSVPKPQFFSTPVATPTEIILSLTDEEFHYLYPDFFISGLMESQKFIAEYDSAYKPLGKIESDSQVRFIEEKLVAALVSAGMLAKEQADRYITTIRFTLPELQLVELGYRKSSGSNQFGLVNMCFLPANQKGLFFAGLIEMLRGAFIPEAQAYPCGYCYILPECYQVGASNPAVGANTWASFCYCTGCYMYLGCLSRCTSQSAIWDPTTGICGCG